MIPSIEFNKTRTKHKSKHSQAANHIQQYYIPLIFPSVDFKTGDCQRCSKKFQIRDLKGDDPNQRTGFGYC